ncbi:MAG: hypothetical protein ABSC93_05505 [Bryobacteraceae bacterium]|jgi:hypothetical protein
MPTPLPPASTEYETEMHAAPGKLPQVHQWKMFRSSQGETHLDFGKTGLISKPGANQTILLDHVKREAHILPAPPHAPSAPPPPTAPTPPAGLPHLPTPPASPLLHVKDLGPKIIGGHPTEGKLYTFQPPKPPAPPALKGLPTSKFTAPPLGALPKPPALPKAPALPKPPALPQLPGMPKPPAPPQAPGVQPPTAPKPPAPPSAKPPAQLQTLEVWTHTKLKIPVLTKATGMPSLKSSVLKNAKGAEPPAALFQIPKGYKLVPPKLPAAPKLPALKPPTLPTPHA